MCFFCLPVCLSVCVFLCLLVYAHIFMLCLLVCHRSCHRRRKALRSAHVYLNRRKGTVSVETFVWNLISSFSSNKLLD